MKKIYLILFLIISIFMISSCGKNSENVLECSFDSNIDLYNNSTIIKLNNSKLLINQKFTIKNEYKDLLNIETLFDSIYSSYSSLLDKGIEIKSNKNNLSFDINMNIDISKIDNEVKNNIINYFNIDVNKNMNEIKKSLEIDGYICK